MAVAESNIGHPQCGSLAILSLTRRPVYWPMLG